MDGRPDDLLEEPLFLNGALIRRWDEFARLARPDGAVDDRVPGRGTAGSPAGQGDVPVPRTPGALERMARPTD